jgi:hypothetical protein
MADTSLVISADEKDYLLRLLEFALGNDRLEEHRTERSAYRKLVQQEISLIEHLLAKLKQTAV